MIKQHGRDGPLQITLLTSFLQIWLLPRIRSFRRKHPDIELRFHTTPELVDFSHAPIHVGIRFGRGVYPNLHCEKLLDDWIMPVGTPELIKHYGMIERGAQPLRDDAAVRCAC
jgi:LysR family glycine cleavage system transcriptional activator